MSNARTSAIIKQECAEPIALLRYRSKITGGWRRVALSQRVQTLIALVSDMRVSEKSVSTTVILLKFEIKIIYARRAPRAAKSYSLPELSC